MNCGNCHRELAEYSNFCYYCGARQTVANPPAAGARKRLMRSAVDCKIAGVCGGIAEYLDSDTTVIRLVFALVTFVTGIFPGFVVYLIAWIVMPVAPVYSPAQQPNRAQETAHPA
jgi:phage shock protein C